MTIEGQSLIGGGASLDTVVVGDLVVSNIDIANETMIVGVVGNGTAGSVDVVVTADTGAQVTQNDGFEYLAIGVIDSISPASGQQGSLVTISGERMLGGGESIESLSLAGIAVFSVKTSGDTSIVAIAAVSAESVVGDIEIGLP